MRQRGRKSVAALATAIAKPRVINGGFGKAPEPPQEMPEAQKEIWRKTIVGEPATLFNTAVTQWLLLDYCRHRHASDEFSSLIDAFPPEVLEQPAGMRRYEWLLRMRQRETKAAADLATKLRLTNISRWQPTTVAAQAENETGPMPWEK
jgi:hypothetical protein